LPCQQGETLQFIKMTHFSYHLVCMSWWWPKGQNAYLVNETTLNLIEKVLGTSTDCVKWYSEYKIRYNMSYIKDVKIR